MFYVLTRRKLGHYLFKNNTFFVDNVLFKIICENGWGFELLLRRLPLYKKRSERLFVFGALAKFYRSSFSECISADLGRC
jgi:hypothetical protein